MSEVTKINEAKKQLENLKEKLGEKIKPKQKSAPEKINLDSLDKLMVENSILKEQNEAMRHDFRALQLKGDRERLHDHLVKKYNIDLETSTFAVENGRVIIISPK